MVYLDNFLEENNVQGRDHHIDNQLTSLYHVEEKML